MDQPTIDPQQLAQQLPAQAKTDGVELVGPNGLLNQLTATVLETALEAEKDEHLGYQKHQVEGRNNSPAPKARRNTKRSCGARSGWPAPTTTPAG